MQQTFATVEESQRSRTFHKLRHRHHFPPFYEVVMVTESQWDLGDVFKNNVRVKMLGNQSL